MSDSDEEQTTLPAFTGGTSEIDVTRTIRCKLETSQAKNDLVQAGIDAYQQVARRMADRLPSYPAHEWTGRHSHMYHQAKRHLPDDRRYKTTLAQKAQQRVAEAYASWRERGKPGDSPRGDFGEGQYLALRHDDCETVTNDRGWGLKTSFIAYNPVWFHIAGGGYQAEYLERVTDEDDAATAGACELHLEADGTLYCHQTITWPVEVYDPADVSTVVGVDLNDDPLVAAAVVTEGDDGLDIKAVELESGAEYRHHRERVKRRRAKAMGTGDLQGAKSARNTYLRYTDHVTDVASKRVVDLAEAHAPAMIRLEDLAHYRETADDPIHDWPFDKIHEKIAYKAQERGIPIEVIDPRYTSTTCRRCGETNPAARDGADFQCLACDYQVHADVNAAINIANGGGTQ